MLLHVTSSRLLCACTPELGWTRTLTKGHHRFFALHIHCEHFARACIRKALATRARQQYLPVRASGLVMVFCDLLRRFLCCSSKRIGIKETHELPCRPEQSSPVPSIPSHSPQHHAESPQRPRDSLDGTQEDDSASSMPPKRKNTDNAAAMDRPEKKTKAPKKGAKAAPEGKSTVSSFHS